MRVQFVHRLGDEERKQLDSVSLMLDENMGHIAQHVDELQSAVRMLSAMHTVQILVFVLAAGIALIVTASRGKD